MSNERLRAALRTNQHTAATVAEAVGVDPKTVHRWISGSTAPHTRTALQVASLLDVSVSWLWPDRHNSAPSSSPQVVAFYPRRSDTPKQLWLDLLRSARQRVDFLTFAGPFIFEDNPSTLHILREKAEAGVPIRIALGDPESEAVKLRGREEGLSDAIQGRVRMALSYHSPLIRTTDIEFRLHATTLYNSIYRYDNQMLVNQHIYGLHGYLAPILHLRRMQELDIFDTYAKSFERVWEESHALPASML